MNQDDDVVDDVHATHKDHNEGIYIWIFNPHQCKKAYLRH